MPDHDRRQDYRDNEGRDDSAWARGPERGAGPGAGRDEPRAFGQPSGGQPPYGDARTYGRQGQRGGASFRPEDTGNYGRDPNPAARQGRGGGSYGQGDYSRAAQRSDSRADQRYGDSSWTAGEHAYDLNEREYGGAGGYSGFGSSGQGQYGEGGSPRGGYGQSGYGRDYGQSGLGGAEPAGGGAYGGGDRGQTYDADFDPHYLDWRRDQQANYDRDYHHWRETQLKAHDEEYRAWRDQRRSKFHEDFHEWRNTRAAGGESSQASQSDQAPGMAHATGMTGASTKPAEQADGEPGKKDS